MKKRRKNYYRVIILNVEGTDPQNNVIALIWGSFLFYLKNNNNNNSKWLFPAYFSVLEISYLSSDDVVFPKGGFFDDVNVILL